MRVLFLTRYGYEAASSRQRFSQYIKYLKSSGIECVIKPFFWNGYLKDRFDKKKTLKFFKYLLSSYINRVKILREAKKYDLLFLQMECFPYLPVKIEHLLYNLNIPRIYDYDDAWFHRYSEHQNVFLRTLLGSKISNEMHAASGVIVGSTYLYKYANQFQHNVVLIPTSIDLDQYPSVLPVPDPNDPFTIGWIGSPATAPFIKELLGILRRFCSIYRAQIVLIGAERQKFDIPNLIYVKWEEQSEVKEISKFDVGLMPLPDTPFTRGKCAFKLIQYMGCWKPVIASPVGENIKVVEHGVNGFFAKNPDQWFDALKQLYNNRELGRTMGMEGRTKVEREYSLEVAVPQIIKIFRKAVVNHKKDMGAL